MAWSSSLSFSKRLLEAWRCGEKTHAYCRISFHLLDGESLITAHDSPDEGDSIMVLVLFPERFLGTHLYRRKNRSRAAC